MPSSNVSSVPISLLLADTGEVVVKKTVSWHSRAVFSSVAFDKYIVRVGNLTDGVTLASCADMPVDLMGDEYVFTRAVTYVATPLPMIAVDIFVDSDNETDAVCERYRNPRGYRNPP